DAEMIHQAEMVVSVGVPWPVHFQGPRGLAALGVAQIGRDHAELALELVERVERVGREGRDRGVQPAPGDDQQREAGTDLLIVDADVAFLIKRHGSLSLHSVVFRALAHRPDTRAPGVVGALRVRSASPLRGLLYALWSRRSRLASARGGAHNNILHAVMEPPILSPLLLNRWC